MDNTGFTHDIRGSHRPQILLIGNGLERACGCEDWAALINGIDVRHFDSDTQKAVDKLPFPLQYELMATPDKAPAAMTKDDIKAEEKRLAAVMKGLLNSPIDIEGKYSIFKELTGLPADHIFTTNYSYCPEKAFLPSKSFANHRTRQAYRFNYNPELGKNGAPRSEVSYRIHTGYKMPGGPAVWHIHGECSVPSGVVLGHDRYGRLLSRIVRQCGGIDFENRVKGKERYNFRSWPELFLFGDVYVLGFGFADCEFDLWWLLRRKQRERFADGRVYYYEHDPVTPANVHQLLLKSHSAELVTNRYSDGKRDSFAAFYREAIGDIKAKMEYKRAI